MSTIARLRWSNGLDINLLFDKMKETMTNSQRHFKTCLLDYNTSGGRLRADVKLPQNDFKIVGADCYQLRWQLLCKETGSALMYITISRNEGPQDPYNAFKNDKVIRVAVSMPEDFMPRRFMGKPDVLRGAIENYHLLKHLMLELECDSIDGNSDGFDRGIYEGDPDPGFEGKLFRFAKTGRQILIMPLEERREVRKEELDSGSWRNVID
jgi:hypothetical protein